MKDNKRFHINGIHSSFTPKEEQDAIGCGVRREWTMNWCVMPIEMNKVVIPILIEKQTCNTLDECSGIPLKRVFGCFSLRGRELVVCVLRACERKK